MVRYITVRDSEENTKDVIAKLELDGWLSPEYWTGEEGFPEDWPQTAIDSLIFLSPRNGLSFGSSEGLRICERIANTKKPWPFGGGMGRFGK